MPVRGVLAAKTRRFIFPGAVAAMVAIVSSPAYANGKSHICLDMPLAYAAATSSLIPPPCTVAAGGYLISGSYYQNASSVGGTALAAYPLIQITAGITQRVELVLNLPSQIAESGLHGSGLYPRTHSGYGLRYRLAERTRVVVSSGLQVVPPASPYTPNETQPKYSVDLSSAYRLTHVITMRGIAAATTSHTRGFGRIIPVEALGADIAASRQTLFSTDLGSRNVSRTHGQGFADIGITQSLDRHLVFNVGLGTAFNSVTNTKAHYLSTALTFHP